ncbi:endolytic transglycosylase MltG [Patescibacteria group bacterium]|nr:endolytic transglycosylase MltG [Patescibacteria group bacterium]
MGFYVRAALIGGIIFSFLVYLFLFSAPRSFPQQLLLPVHSGETGYEIASALKASDAIRSQLVFRALLRLSGSSSHVIAGTYYFPHPQNVFTIVWRLQTANFGVEPIKVTIPEGNDVARMSAILEQALPTFDSGTFLTIAKPQEGYLFPDTYFLYPGQSMSDIVKAMRDNFTAHIQDTVVQQTLTASGRSQTDLVIMASLLEKEAPDTANRQIISGILWKRLSLGMPLQVDAVFPFITGKPIDAILQSDYKIDSPYNTYLYKGLPRGPITNPGLDAIIAAATPTTTPYLYYLSDKKGVFHYSKTFNEQLANQRKYLK